MKDKGSSWDHSADRDLLLAIISEAQITSVKWVNISEKMRSKDYTFTAEACRQHVQKLRKDFGNSSSTPGGPARGTPSKKATGTSGAAKSKKRKVADESLDNNDDDEEDWGGNDAGDSPSAKKKKRMGLKKEEEIEDEGFASQSASSFKTEELNDKGKVKRRQVVDIENDDLYEG